VDVFFQCSLLRLSGLLRKLQVIFLRGLLQALLIKSSGFLSFFEQLICPTSLPTWLQETSLTRNSGIIRSLKEFTHKFLTKPSGILCFPEMPIYPTGHSQESLASCTSLRCLFINSQLTMTSGIFHFSRQPFIVKLLKNTQIKAGCFRK